MQSNQAPAFATSFLASADNGDPLPDAATVRRVALSWAGTAHYDIKSPDPVRVNVHSTHRPHSSAFLGLPNRITNRSHKKELLWGLWVMITQAWSVLLQFLLPERRAGRGLKCLRLCTDLLNLLRTGRKADITVFSESSSMRLSMRTIIVKAPTLGFTAWGCSS